ncbi:MAG TPA: IS256 family transposase [Candidatus Kryptobacter bacterium]|nr:IS256 family transposase [Candidatus Kryptobacter bacterium]
MGKKKVARRNDEIKLSINGMPDGEFDIEGLMNSLKVEIRSLAVSAGTVMIEAIMNSESDQLAGKRYSRKTDIDRWGTESGYVLLGGQKVRVRRPRLRTKDKQEVSLTSYEQFQNEGQRTESVFNRLVAGVSSRNYAKTVEEFGNGYGISKSVISRKVVEATAEKLKELCERDLSKLDVCVLVLDGIHVDETVQIVALGVETSGKKHILGMRQGATENSIVCKELLEDIQTRGLQTDGPMLVLLDGAKALRSAVEETFGDRAIVQRCPVNTYLYVGMAQGAHQLHKRRNVLKYLPKRYHAEYDRKISTAYGMRLHDDARKELDSIIRELDRLNESAANSLREGLEETLTVHQLKLPDILRKHFSSTNLIESAFSQGVQVMNNVKRWRNSSQIQRYTATALLEAEKKFRKITGFKSMSVLVSALEEEYRRRTLDTRQIAA